MSAALLDVRGIEVRFDGLKAVDGVSFSQARGTLTGLIGPNGAGKTTLLRTVTGTVRPVAGAVSLDGRDISALPVHRRARLGLGMSNQIVRPFRSMTVLDNVSLAAGLDRTRNPLAALLAVSRTDQQARARDLLDLVGIADAADAEPENLPLGYLKRLEVARALALQPKLLLLDEPTEGVWIGVIEEIVDRLSELARDIGLVIVEQHLDLALRVSDFAYVLDRGRVALSGSSDDVRNDPQLLRLLAP